MDSVHSLTVDRDLYMRSSEPLTGDRITGLRPFTWASDVGGRRNLQVPRRRHDARRQEECPPEGPPPAIDGRTLYTHASRLAFWGLREEYLSPDGHGMIEHPRAPPDTESGTLLTWDSSEANALALPTLRRGSGECSPDGSSVFTALSEYRAYRP